MMPATRRRGRSLKNPRDNRRKKKDGWRETCWRRLGEPINEDERNEKGRNNEEDEGGQSKTTSEEEMANGGEKQGTLPWTWHPEELEGHHEKEPATFQEERGPPDTSHGLGGRKGVLVKEN
ncbi:hypothetical protein NDU88_001212 [Pleurodeles waltl]|uniref:Uncharacterized protein n=1 Tax=Pleurodeles waltl TaxID=8319 RepID=A0AAV7MJ35_PLEWA|nr:hypothetical protein NDU88_001212 [Pleurodeles waltl]